MKKVVLTLCAAGLLAGMTACGKKSAAGEAPVYTEEEVSLGDSLATAYGAFMAVQAQQQIQQIKTMRLTPAQAEAFDVDKYMKGVKEVANVDTADMSYILGLQMGINLWSAAQGMPAQLKVPASAAKMLAAFQQTMKLDSIADPYAYQGQFQQLMQRVEALGRQKELDALNNSEESIANIAAGVAYADSLVENAGYTRSESGLVYIIDNPGSDNKVEKTSRIKLRYKGMHTDGTVFDQTREEPMTSYANQFIPGFTEGLTMLGEGGKATIVIPGDLAYGPRGQKPTIGSNETLVFDIEIEEILK